MDLKRTTAFVVGVELGSGVMVIDGVAVPDLSRNGQRKLRTMISGIPQVRQDVRVEITAVSVSLDDLEDDLRLAAKRARVLQQCLSECGVQGTYSETIGIEDQLRTADKVPPADGVIEGQITDHGTDHLRRRRLDDGNASSTMITERKDCMRLKRWMAVAAGWSLALGVGMTSGASPVSAADSLLLDSNATLFDGLGIGSDKYVAAEFTADGPATVTEATIVVGMDAGGGPYSATSMSFYSDTSSHPTSAGNLLGTLTYDSDSPYSADPRQDRLRFTGSVSIPSSGTYWLKLSTGMASGIKVRFGTGYASSPWTAASEGTNTQGDGNYQIRGGVGNPLVSYYPSITISGTPGSGGSGGTPSSGGSGGGSTRAVPQVVSVDLDLEAAELPASWSQSSILGSWYQLPVSSDVVGVGENAGKTFLGVATSEDFPVAIAQRQVDNGWGVYEICDADGRLESVFIPAGKSLHLTAVPRLHAIWSQ